MIESQRAHRGAQPAYDTSGPEFVAGVTSVSEAFVHERLFYLPDLLPAMKRFFIETPSTRIAQFGRVEYDLPEGREYLMPARVGKYDGLKWISSRPGNSEYALERSQSVMVIKNAETGQFLHTLPGTELTPAKTALVTLTALREWKQATAVHSLRVGIIGGGSVARAHLKGIYQEFEGQIETALVFSPRDSGGRLVGDLGLAYPCQLAEKQEIFDACNVIISATTAVAPILTPAGVVDRHEPLFLAGIGFNDLAGDFVAVASNIISEDPLSYQKQSYPFAAALPNYLNARVLGLSELCNSQERLQPNGITIFAPFGTAMTDLAVSLSILDIQP